MSVNESDIQFSELIAQCRVMLSENRFDEIFELLAQFEIPRQGDVVLAKALWLRVKIDQVNGDLPTEEKLNQIKNNLQKAFSSLQDVYVNINRGYLETSSGFELFPKSKKDKSFQLLKRKKTLASFFKKKVISLDEFMGYIEENGITRLEATGELNSIKGLVHSWEGKAGSLVQINPHHDQSGLYLIFWPSNDKMFQLDPLVAFFDYSNKPILEKIARGDKVVIQGKLDINESSPKISLRSATIVKHVAKNSFFK